MYDVYWLAGWLLIDMGIKILELRVRLQKGVMVSVKMMMSENQSSQSQVLVTAFQGTQC
jgi:hypothetical protein